MYRLNYLKVFLQASRKSKINHKYMSTLKDAPTKYFTVLHEESNFKRRIAYQLFEGAKDVTVMYVPGFMSDKSGIKSTSLVDFCATHKFKYLRYDPTGLGESNDVPLNESCFSHWLQDAELALNISSSPHIIVTSSMGSWISLILREKYPEKIKGMILIGPGINFIHKYAAKIRQSLTEEELEKLENGGIVYFNMPNYPTFTVTKQMVLDMENYELDLDKGPAFNCPIRIFHGVLDAEVPYEESVDIMKSLRTDDVHLTLVKDGEHRLCRKQDLDLIFDQILKLETQM